MINRRQLASQVYFSTQFAVLVEIYEVNAASHRYLVEKEGLPGDPWGPPLTLRAAFIYSIHYAQKALVRKDPTNSESLD